jgi:hypothetical protein
MSNILVHPIILQHPGRIKALQQRTGMVVIKQPGLPPRLIAPAASQKRAGPEAA